MPSLSSHLQFALVALAMVLTPGPNMIYLVSRAICQGRMAGLISLGGIALGFMVYLLCAAAGITAIFMSVPLAYDALARYKEGLGNLAHGYRFVWRIGRPLYEAHHMTGTVFANIYGHPTIGSAVLSCNHTLKTSSACGS